MIFHPSNAFLTDLNAIIGSPVMSLHELYNNLEKAVKEERYEDAAFFRDKISELQTCLENNFNKY